MILCKTQEMLRSKLKPTKRVWFSLHYSWTQAFHLWPSKVTTLACTHHSKILCNNSKWTTSRQYQIALRMKSLWIPWCVPSIEPLKSTNHLSKITKITYKTSLKLRYFSNKWSCKTPQLLIGSMLHNMADFFQIPRAALAILTWSKQWS